MSCKSSFLKSYELSQASIKKISQPTSFVTRDTILQLSPMKSAKAQSPKRDYDEGLVPLPRKNKGAIESYYVTARQVKKPYPHMQHTQTKASPAFSESRKSASGLYGDCSDADTTVFIEAKIQRPTKIAANQSYK